MRHDEPYLPDPTTEQVHAQTLGVADLDVLLAGARERRTAHLGRLMALYGDALRAKLTAYCGDDVADEVVNDVFLSLPQRLQRYSDDGRFEHWLFRVAFNIARTKRRSARRLEGHYVESELEAVYDPSITSELTKEQLVELALARLSPAGREVYFLVQQGLSREEIAAALHLSVGTVDVRLSRARKSLESLKHLL